MPEDEVDPEVRRRADRHLRILYAVMVAGIVLPVVLWWLFGLR
jgi:hypothetical protein